MQNGDSLPRFGTWTSSALELFTLVIGEGLACREVGGALIVDIDNRTVIVYSQSIRER